MAKKTKKEKEKEEEEERNNFFDKIFKENITEIFLPFVNQLLGLEIKFENLKEITESLHTTIERKPDFLRKIVGGDFSALLQIEFQTKNDIKMHFRMLEYCSMLMKKHNLPVYQVVIYIGDEKMNMKEEIKEHNISFEYDVISLQDESYKHFLDSDEPEMAILAILADFEQEKPENIITSIIQKLKTISEKNPRFKDKPAYDKYFRQLSILSKIRDLQPLTQKIIDIMAITFKIEDDVFYQKGIQKGVGQGIEQGIEKGIEQGIEQGSQKKEEQTILNAYKKGKKIHEIAEFLDLDIDYVKKIIEKNEQK